MIGGAMALFSVAGFFGEWRCDIMLRETYGRQLDAMQAVSVAVELIRPLQREEMSLLMSVRV